MIADTIGGPSKMDNKIPLIISLKNNHIVCCRRGIKYGIREIIRKYTGQHGKLPTGIPKEK